MVVVRTFVKEELDKCNLGGDFIQELDFIVKSKIQKAQERALANGRKTVYAKDL